MTDEKDKYTEHAECILMRAECRRVPGGPFDIAEGGKVSPGKDKGGNGSASPSRSSRKDS